jgi:hypothetical protein
LWSNGLKRIARKIAKSVGATIPAAAFIPARMIIALAPITSRRTNEGKRSPPSTSPISVDMLFHALLIARKGLEANRFI